MSLEVKTDMEVNWKKKKKLKINGVYISNLTFDLFVVGFPTFKKD